MKKRKKENIDQINEASGYSGMRPKSSKQKSTEQGIATWSIGTRAK
jgi:hypothetical protein